MAIKYGGIQKIASKLLSSFGRVTVPLIVRRGDVDVQTSGVFIEYESKEVDGDLVRREDQRLILPGDLPFELDKEQDVIIDGDDVLQIISAIPVRPGDTTIVWRLQTRR